jgi:D-alanine-D-alanine ligase
VDVRLGADGRANIIEVNPLPGILPDPAENSCLPKAAREAGLDYDALIGACLRAAADRQRMTLAPRHA